MGVPIQNANQLPLNLTTGTLPNMSEALTDWFQPMKAIRVKKYQINFQTVERGEAFQFQGVIQPYKPRELQIKTEGQRSWRWFQLHCDPTVKFDTDDVFYIGSTRYRVMYVNEYAPYAYMEYLVIQDYQDENKSPPLPTDCPKTFSDNISLENPSDLTADVTVIGDGGLDNAFQAEWQLWLLHDDGSQTQYQVQGAIQVIDELTVRITVNAVGVYKLTGVQ